MNADERAPTSQGGSSNDNTKPNLCAPDNTVIGSSRQVGGHRSSSWVNFRTVNQAAMRQLPLLLDRWLPGGVRRGEEYTTLNPTRIDRHLGSFLINVRTGRWADFATGDKGTDVISLAAYLTGISQHEAAWRLAVMLGLRRG